MKFKNLTLVVLCGGVGSRLWPLSRKSLPKQYLKIFGNKSLFKLTLERNLNYTDKLIVVGSGDNINLCRDEICDASVNFSAISEALARNTAAAIAFSIMACDPEEILLITPSDHIIKDFDFYSHAIERAFTLAKKGHIVTFGIVPKKPDTGYGYIETSGENVLSFREKPNKETATSFLNSGNFLWNSGMFCFRAKVMLEELQKFEPEIYETSKKAWENQKNGVLFSQDMKKIPSKSIDYAVMEKSKKIKVVKSDFFWSDLGSFESLYDYFKAQGYPVDDFGNMAIGNKNFTSFIGLRNTILVQTKDVNLILRKENSQEVKGLYEKLQKEKSRYI